MAKKCSKCKELKKLDKFYNCRKCKYNKTPQCKVCMTKTRVKRREEQRLYMQKLREDNPEKVKKSKRRSWRNQDPRKKMYLQSKNRSKRKDIEFNLSIEDIVIPKKCPLLEIEFIPGTQDYYEQTHSLDRIDPKKGYIKGNVWVITKKANSMKNSASQKELMLFAFNLYKHLGKKDDIVRAVRKLTELLDKEPTG